MSNLRLIKQTATSSGISSVSIEDVFSSDFDIYKITVARTTYDVSNTNVIALKARFISAGGSIVSASNYDSANMHMKAETTKDEDKFENGTYSGSAGKTNSLFRNFTSVQIGWIYTRVGVVTVPDDEGGTETISYSNSGSACANALPANIASNIATINTLRTGIGTLSSPVTTIKAEKGFKQMAQHGMRNSKVIVTNRIVGIASAVGIISAYGS